MATLEKRGHIWRVKIRRTGLPAQTRSFDSKSLAQRWARGVEAEMDQGITVDRRIAERTTLADVLDRYRREVTPSKRGARDENLRLKAMAQRPFTRIRNPCSLVRRPPPGRPRNRRLQDDEEQRLLAACRAARNPWLVHFVALAIETGMRRSELLGLLSTHVDLERRVAYLPLTKNGESRGVPLSTIARAHWPRAAGRVRGRVLSATIESGNGCVTQTTESPGFPGRFTFGSGD